MDAECRPTRPRHLGHAKRRLAVRGQPPPARRRGRHGGSRERDPRRAYSRLMGYRSPNPGLGYFAPDRFTLGEGRAGLRLAPATLVASASGGLGAQQVGPGAPTQAEWHGDSRWRVPGARWTSWRSWPVHQQCGGRAATASTATVWVLERRPPATMPATLKNTKINIKNANKIIKKNKIIIKI